MKRLFGRFALAGATLALAIGTMAASGVAPLDTGWGGKSASAAGSASSGSNARAVAAGIGAARGTVSR